MRRLAGKHSKACEERFAELAWLFGRARAALLLDEETLQRARSRFWASAVVAVPLPQLTVWRRVRLALIGAVDTWNIMLWGTMVLTCFGRAP